MKTFVVKYQKDGTHSIVPTTVKASSASQAKEQIKSRFNGKVKIISCVER